MPELPTRGVVRAARLAGVPAAFAVGRRSASDAGSVAGPPTR